MGKYNGAVITTAGQNIIAESISGTLLEWTVMRSSSVAIPAGTNLEALTSLTGIEQSTHITDASVYGNNVLQVSARFSNTGVSTAYLIQTVGIYGQLTGGSETLIAVMTAVTPDEMPVYDPDSPSAFIFNTQITVTNADSVTMVVNDTGTATVADLNRKVDISGGDVSDTVVNTVVAESAEYPVPAAGDTVKVIIGKIAKFFSDIVRPFTGATSSAVGKKGLVPAPSAGQQTAYMRGDGQWIQPQNNATTTQNGYVLDAKMGKTLQDQITSLNNSLAIQTASVALSNKDTNAILMKTGHVCMLVSLADFQSVQAGTNQIGTIPEAYKPNTNYRFSVANNTRDASMWINITSTGIIQLYSATASSVPVNGACSCAWITSK
ncbi:MAG: hypothetical protein IIZ93_05175 [Acidaminococcaceae bacterium]|nr:hypothetical protein [Acidaminococcaceae bacterium]